MGAGRPVLTPLAEPWACHCPCHPGGPARERGAKGRGPGPSPPAPAQPAPCPRPSLAPSPCAAEPSAGADRVWWGPREASAAAPTEAGGACGSMRQDGGEGHGPARRRPHAAGARARAHMHMCVHTRAVCAYLCACAYSVRVCVFARCIEHTCSLCVCTHVLPVCAYTMCAHVFAVHACVHMCACACYVHVCARVLAPCTCCCMHVYACAFSVCSYMCGMQNTAELTSMEAIGHECQHEGQRLPSIRPVRCPLTPVLKRKGPRRARGGRGCANAHSAAMVTAVCTLPPACQGAAEGVRAPG